MPLRNLKPGDMATRLISDAKIPHKVRVVSVTDDLIYVSPAEFPAWPQEECWKFERNTGVELDEELNWGTKYGVTGSVLTDTREEGEHAPS